MSAVPLIWLECVAQSCQIWSYVQYLHTTIGVCRSFHLNTPLTMLASKLRCCIATNDYIICTFVMWHDTYIQLKKLPYKETWQQSFLNLNDLVPNKLSIISVPCNRLFSKYLIPVINDSFCQQFFGYNSCAACVN